MYLNSTHRDPSPRRKQSSTGLRIVALASLTSLMICVLAATSHAQLVPSSQVQVTPQLLIGPAVAEMTPQLENDVRQALASYQSGDLAGARVWLERAKEREPSLPPTDLTLAKLHYVANKPALGRATLEQVVMKYPTDPEAYLIFADRALVAGRVTDAELLYLKSVDLIRAFDSNLKRKQSFKLRTRAGLAGVAERRGQWAEAVAHLKAWIREDPKSATAQSRLGKALFMVSQGVDNKQVREAYKALQEARKIDPTLPNADLMIGHLYTQVNKRSQAENFMNRAIQSDGKTLGTVVSVTQWWLEGDQLDKAEPLLAQALKMNPKARDVVLLNGVAARMKKDYKSAVEYLLAAHLSAPSDFTAINQLALALIDQVIEKKDRSGLRRAYDFAMLNARQYPKDVNANSTLGWILYQMGRRTEAEQAFTNATKQPSKLSPDSRYFMAKVLFDRGQNDAAAQHLNAALRTSRLFVYRAQAQALLDKIAPTSDKGNSEN